MRIWFNMVSDCNNNFDYMRFPNCLAIYNIQLDSPDCENDAAVVKNIGALVLNQAVVALVATSVHLDYG